MPHVVLIRTLSERVHRESKGESATPYFVYILRMADQRLYVGSTKNVSRRINEHFEGIGAKTTAANGVEELLYWEEAGNRTLAEWRELQIKGWSRAKKLALASSQTKELKALSRCRSLHIPK